MLFLKKHGWWVLIIVICVCISAWILVNRSKNAFESDADGVSLSPLETADSTKQSIDLSTPKKVLKDTEPKTIDDHGHEHHEHLKGPQGPARKLPLDLRKRLEMVKSDGNSYYTNPNFFQEVFEAVNNGQDMETTIKLFKEYGIYTDVILPHMDSYEAFIYIRRNAPTDFKYPATYTGNDMKYAKRLISDGFRSAEALEAGLYIARSLFIRDPQESEMYYRDILEYHPDSKEALYYLGNLLVMDRPMEAIPYLKKVDANSDLGVAYSRLGDYKTAWVYFKIASDTGTGLERSGALRSRIAIESGKPILSPIVRDSELQEKAVGQQREQEMWEKELNAFLEWTGYVVNNSDRQSSSRPEERNFTDSENVLAKELERHLRLEKTRFAPDRLIRGFEYVHRYGQTEGLKRLEKKDPELVKEVRRVLTEKRPLPGLEK